MEHEPGLDLIGSFLVVAEELNFRRSAERLGIDQSALTRRIQKLESLMGFPLFERTTREVSLTPAGRFLHEKNTGLVKAYQESVFSARLVAAGKAGTLRISYMSFAATKLMPGAVSRFRQLYPEVEINLRYMNTQEQKLALSHDEVDIGFLIGPFEHSEFHSETLVEDPLYVVMPHGHRFAGMAEVSPAEVAGEELIIGDIAEWEAYRWRLTDMFAAEGVRLNDKIQASNSLALIGLVAAGLGVTIYPASLIGFLGDRVETRPIANPKFVVQTQLVWKRTSRGRLVSAFVELARAARSAA